MFLTSKLSVCFIDGFTSGMKSQSIAYLLIGSAHIYKILDLEGGVHSIWVVKWPCPHTLVFRRCSVPATWVRNTAQCLGHQQVTPYLLP